MIDILYLKDLLTSILSLFSVWLIQDVEVLKRRRKFLSAVGKKREKQLPIKIIFWIYDIRIKTLEN